MGTRRIFLQGWANSVVSLRLMLPQAVTDGVTYYFFLKKLTTFLVIALCKVMAFLAVGSRRKIVKRMHK